MPLPNGYTLDQPQPKLPAGYTLDPPEQAQPTATMQAAAPRGVSGYLGEVERDLTTGGTRTVVGRGLGYMQGRGDQGYTGLESGVSPQQAQTMGSVPLGVAKVATGLAQIPSSPVQGTLHAAGGALQAATLPLSFMAPEATEAAQAAGTAVAGRVLPSAMKARAAGVFQSIAQDANQMPVALDNAGDAALRLMDWQQKANLGPTLNKFLNRITNPKLGPLTYGEGRDFYQVLGDMSANEKMNLAPAIKRDVIQMVQGLRTDIGNAADLVGRGADYESAMNQYRRAARFGEVLDTVKNVAQKAVIPTTAGAAAGTAYKLWQWMTGK